MLAFRASSTLASDISSKYTTEKGAIRIIGWHLITEESKRLLQSLTNGANVVLMSPRRVGKTQLIYYCFEKRAISDNHITIFIDILKTSTLQEFTYELGKAVFNTLATRGQKMQKMVMTTMRSLMGNIGIDPVTALPTFGIAIGEILAKLSLPQKELLYAIAKEHRAKQITSGLFIRRHSLKSASSVQSSIKKLLEYGLISVDAGTYYIADQLMRLWLIE